MNRWNWRIILLLTILIIAEIFIGIGFQIYRSAVIVIEWSTATELETAGYNLYRSQINTDLGEKINSDLIQAGQDLVTTNNYSYVDRNVLAGERYFYWLEAVDRLGRTSRNAPIEIKAAHRIEGVLLIILGASLMLLLLGLLLRRKVRLSRIVKTSAEGELGKKQVHRYDS